MGVSVIATRPRRLSGEDRLQQLLACAVRVFARDGIGRAGHTQVAELAGVSVPTVFKYFPTRDALVDAVLRQVESTLLELARRSHQNAGSAREAVRAHGRGWCQLVVEQPDLAKVWLEWSASIRDETWPRFLAMEDELNRIIARTIDSDPSSPKNLSALEIARTIHAVAYMIAHMLFGSGQMGQQEAENFALNVIDALLGLKPIGQHVPDFDGE